MNQLKVLTEQHGVIEVQRFVRNYSVEVEDIQDLLIYAIQKEVGAPIIEYFIQLLQYNLNYCSRMGQVPLFTALQYKNYYIADRLLEHKADINYIDKNGENVLLYLYQKKVLDETMLLYLLDKGVDVSYCQRKTDKTFLDYIDEYRNRNFIHIILKYFYNNDVEVVLKLILSHKKQWGLSDRHLKETIRHRINPSVKNKLMLLAYHHNNIDLLKFLFKSSEDNIDFIKKYEQQEKFIDYKIYSNELEILLIENGEDIDGIVPNCYDNQYTELLRICKFTNILERVKFLISYGAKMNQKSVFRNEFSDPGTPIIFAIQRESLDIVKYLYESGADCLKMKDDAKNYALKAALGNLYYLKMLTEGTSYLNPRYLLKTVIEACALNNIEAIKYFVEHGIDINERLDDGRYGERVTPLLVACQNQHIEIVRYLIEHHAHLDFLYNIRMKNGEKMKGTVLNYTLTIQNKEISHCLIQHNAGIFDTEKGHTKRIVKNDIGLVYRYGGLTMASYIIKNRRLRTEVDEKGNTILMKVVNSFLEEDANRTISYLKVKPGIDVNAQNQKGQTLLMLACLKKSYSIVKGLLNEDDKMNNNNNNGGGSSSSSSRSNSSNSNNNGNTFVKVNVNSVDGQGHSALMIACQQQDLNLVQLLIEHGADVNQMNTKKETALLFSCKNNNEEIIKYLIENGANLHQSDDQDRDTTMAMEIDFDCDREEMYHENENKSQIQIKQERRKNEDQGNHPPKMDKDYSFLDHISTKKAQSLFLKECQPKKNKKIGRGSSINYELLNRLLRDHGVDIDGKDRYGKTALMMACEQSQLDLVKFLVVHGANINMTAGNGHDHNTHWWGKDSPENHAKTKVTIKIDTCHHKQKKKSKIQSTETAMSIAYKKIEEVLVNHFFDRGHHCKQKRRKGKEEGEAGEERGESTEDDSMQEDNENREEENRTSLLHTEDTQRYPVHGEITRNITTHINNPTGNTNTNTTSTSTSTTSTTSGTTKVKMMRGEERKKRMMIMDQEKWKEKMKKETEVMKQREKESKLSHLFSPSNPQILLGMIEEIKGELKKGEGGKGGEEGKEGEEQLMAAHILTFLIRQGGRVEMIRNAIQVTDLTEWNEAYLQYYLHNHLNVNGITKNGDTALHFACNERHFKLIRQLIEEGGADINGQDREGKTIFMLATVKVNKVILNYLLDHHVNGNLQDRHGTTALMYSCKRENLDMVRYLMEIQKVQLNLRDHYGKNELMMACQKGNLFLVKYLMREGADKMARDKNGVSVLMYACKSGSIPLIQYLVEQEGMQFQSKEEINCSFMKSVLSRACIFNYSVMIQWLIEQGMEVNTRFQSQFLKGETPLMVACDYGHFDLVKILLAKGADINMALQPTTTTVVNNQQNNNTVRPTQLHSINSSNTSNSSKSSSNPLKPLDSAIFITSPSSSSSSSSSTLPIAKKVKTSIKSIPNDESMTCSNTTDPCIPTFTNTTPTTTTTLQGKLAYMFAYQSHHYEIAIYLLRQPGAMLNEEVEREIDVRRQTFLSLLCQDQSYLSYIQFLVEEKGASIHARDQEGNTPFLLTCAYGNQEMVKYLHQKGSSPCETNHQKESALEFACSNGKNRIVEYLIDKGAPLDSVNKQGCTPLMMACYALRHRPMDWNERDGVLSNIKYLINLGAKIDVQDKNRMTALLHFYRSRIYYNDTLLIRKYLKLTVKKLAILQNTLDGYY
ncbi:hypothetical protein PIROE2DRAFT_9903 [Piromyces sp. E2]|nr:hypothetical protein PIROE2DRAFT_9903 [Piromyces sp. E2]|eukprot:OUM63552.1 hypothetical protein PIROE2DRAFT_9903 [Piromyces sp. E2]